jgi:hypothetical protein
MYKVYKRRFKESNISEAEFIKPTIERNLDELERTQIEKFVDLKKLLHAFTDNGTLELLTEDEWRNLENSDSFGIDSYEQAQSLAEEYGKDIQEINQVFREGGKLEAPTILYKDEENPYLVNGNTRLMYMRAKDITPMVWKIFYNEQRK